MTALADLERLLERLFERTSARVFRTRLRPVQLQRRIERAMELGRVSGKQRTVVPDRFRVHLNPKDLTALGEGEDLGDVAARLADGALAFARAHGFQLLERPTVALVADPTTEAGQLTVDATFGGRRSTADQAAPAIERSATPRPGSVPAVGGSSNARAGGSARASREDAGRVAPAASSTSAASAGGVAPVAGLGGLGPDADSAAAPAAAQPGERRPGIRDPRPDPDDLTRTLVFRRPIVAAPRAVLRVVDKRGRERTVEIDGTILAIGRARDNGLVIDDTRISRYHARLQARRGALVFTDLGSTNGSRVNGMRVDEIALGLGDRIELGDTTLVVESLPG